MSVPDAYTWTVPLVGRILKLLAALLATLAHVWDAARARDASGWSAARPAAAERTNVAARPASCSASAGPSSASGSCVLVVSGAAASAGLADLLTNRFTLPGHRHASGPSTILEEHFGQTPDGLVHGRRPGPTAAAPARSCRQAARGRRSAPPRRCRRAASRRVRAGADDVVAAHDRLELEPADAKGYTDDDARRRPGRSRARELYVTGQAAIEHDLDPVFADDLKVGELYIAIPIALADPRLRLRDARVPAPVHVRRCHDPGDARDRLDLRALHGADDLPDEPGHADRARDRDRLLAADRLPLPRGAAERPARQRGGASCATMETAGRAVVFSGTAVAIGLALLLFMPLPFMRGFGVGGLLIPLVSVLRGGDAPAGAALLARRTGSTASGSCRSASLERRDDHEHGFWARLARAIMRRPVLFAVGDDRRACSCWRSPVLALAARARARTRGSRSDLEAVQGLTSSTDAVGAGAVAPTDDRRRHRPRPAAPTDPRSQAASAG